MKNKSNTVNRRAVKIMDFTRDTIKIQVSFSIWDGKLFSSKGVDDVATANNAQKNLIEVKIKAIARRSQAEIYGIKQQMTDIWHEATRPWEQGGWRLGLVVEYPPLRARLDELKRKYDDAVTMTIDRGYPILRQAYLDNVNTLAAYSPFPPKEKLLRKYGCSISADKIASADDYRFSGLSQADAERLALEREEYLMGVIADGNRGLLRDVSATVNSLVESLSNFESKFRGSELDGFPIFRNVENMLTRCDKLNISKDATFTKQVNDVRSKLKSIDPTLCQVDLNARKEAVKVTKSLLDDLCTMTEE